MTTVIENRHATSAEAFLEALGLHPTWRLEDGRVHRDIPGHPPMTVTAAAGRFADLGWIRVHRDGDRHYWTAHKEGWA